VLWSASEINALAFRLVLDTHMRLCIRYIGVNDAGIVHGTPMRRDDRDTFRLQISQMARSFTPAVLPGVVAAVFLPVVGRGAAANAVVVEIRVQPGLSTTQPIPYENRSHQAFLR
jgi:hypothetical protein